MSTASSTDHSVPAQWKQQTIFSFKSGKRNFTTEEDVQMIENLPLWKKELLIKKQKHLQNQPHQQHKNGLLLNSPPKESSPDDRPTSTSYFYPAVECRRKKSHSRSTNSSLPDLLDDVVYKEEKAKKRLSVNVVSKRKDLVGDDDEDDDTAVREERILPIHLNPILKMDLERRMNEKTTTATTVASASQQQQLLIKSPNRGESKCLDVQTQDELKTVQSIDDSVFEKSIDVDNLINIDNNEMDIIFHDINNNNEDDDNHDKQLKYGKGFVHKILLKFNNLTHPDSPKLSPKRKSSQESPSSSPKCRPISMGTMDSQPSIITTNTGATKRELKFNQAAAFHLINPSFPPSSSSPGHKKQNIQEYKNDDDIGDDARGDDYDERSLSDADENIGKVTNTLCMFEKLFCGRKKPKKQGKTSEERHPEISEKVIGESISDNNNNNNLNKDDCDNDGGGNSTFIINKSPLQMETKGPSKNNYNINNNNKNNNIISNNMSNNINSNCSNKRFLKSCNDRNVTNIDDDDGDDEDNNGEDNVEDDFLLFNYTSTTTTTATTAAVATTTASTTTTTTTTATSKKPLPAKRDFAHDVNVNSNNFSVKLRPTTLTPTATTKIGDGDDGDDDDGDGDGDDKNKSIAQLINKFSTGSPVNKVRSHNNISKNISPTLEDGLQMTTPAATVATASATLTTTTNKPLIINTTTTNNNNRYNNGVNESLTKTQLAPNSFKFTSKTAKQFKSAVTNGSVERVDLVDGDKGSNFSNSSGTAVYTSSTSTTTILTKITTPGKAASAKISTPISTTTTSINTSDVNDINNCNNNIFSSSSCSSSSSWQGMTAKKNVAVASTTLSSLASTSTNVNNSLATSHNNTSELANRTTPLNNLNSVTPSSSATTTTTTSTTTKPSQTLIPRPGKLLIRHSVPTATSINNANDSNTDSSGGNNKLDLRLLPRYTDIRKGEFLPTSQDLLDVLADILGANDDGPDDAILDFEFLGAGVLLEKSMLTKTRNGKLLKTAFDDSTTQTHIYPAENCANDCFDHFTDQECKVISGKQDIFFV